VRTVMLKSRANIREKPGQGQEDGWRAGSLTGRQADKQTDDRH
jgi:hypothetical protein